MTYDLSLSWTGGEPGSPVDPLPGPAVTENEMASSDAARHAEAAVDLLGQATRKACRDGDGRWLGAAAEALLDVQTAHTYALLAVNATLTGIASSLTTVARTPAAVQHLADHVCALDETVGNELAELTEAVHKHSLGVSDDQCEIVKAINEHAETVNDAIDNVAEMIDRPRWWQIRRRWVLRQQRKAIDAALNAIPDLPALEDGRKVEQFLVEVRQDCPPQALATNEVRGRVRFWAEPHAACDTAGTMLPGLCTQLDIVPEQDRQVHGLVYRCTPSPQHDGVEDGYVGMVFLPVAQPASEVSETHEFRVDLCLQADIGEDVPPSLASGGFTAEWGAVQGLALALLPELCAMADVPADPSQIYGRILQLDAFGEFFLVDCAFLPGVPVSAHDIAAE